MPAFHNANSKFRDAKQRRRPMPFGPPLMDRNPCFPWHQRIGPTPMETAMPLAPVLARPTPAPAPDLPPVESLQSTHHELLLALDQLTRLLRGIGDHGATPELRAIAH